MNPQKDWVPVEPLAPPRLDRIEQGVLRAYRNLPPPRRSPLGRFARVALPMLAAVGIAVAFYAGRSTAPTAPTPTRTLAVQTGTDAVDLKVGDIALTFAPNSRAQVIESEGVTVELAQGTVNCDVAPRRARPPFVVVADDVEVTVVGTAFAVERGDDVRVSVDHGRVKVASAHGELFLGDGEAWSRSGNAIAKVDTSITPPTEDPALAALIPGDPVALGSPSTLPLTAPNPTLANRNGQKPAAGTDKTGAAATKPNSANTAKPGALNSAKPSVLSTQIRDVSLTPILALHGAEKDTPVASYASKVAKADSATAAHALYSMAYVHHFEFKQNAEALRALAAYEKRFPHGKEAESVLWLRIRILCARSLDNSCRAAAHSFLRKFPDADGKASIATRIVNEM